MLDEFKVRKPAGFPDHPHRGFETVRDYRIAVNIGSAYNYFGKRCFKEKIAKIKYVFSLKK